MRKHFWLSLLLLLASAPAALATNCPSFTYTLTNGTTADANQVMSNFNTLMNCANNTLTVQGTNSQITQLTGLTTPLTVPQGGTGLGTLTAGSPLVGNGTSTPTFGLSTLTNSLGSDVTMSSSSTFYDGPSVAQGTTGTWFASGHVTVTDSVTDTFTCKLWDGTTVIDSQQQFLWASNHPMEIALSGKLATPATNIKISCENTSTTGSMLFNSSGLSKDSTLTVVRIQ